MIKLTRLCHLQERAVEQVEERRTATAPGESRPQKANLSKRQHPEVIIAATMLDQRNSGVGGGASLSWEFVSGPCREN
jgi:hypothetical protein